MSLYLKITVPPWADRSLRLQARGTARARSVKVPNSEGTPRHAQGSLTIGTGTPNHMMGVPGRACARACQAHGTDKARPGQSLHRHNFTTFPFNQFYVKCLINEDIKQLDITLSLILIM